LKPLSRQEERVLGLARQGLGDKQIAAELSISLETVRTYWQRIREKVGAATRAEIVATLSEESTAAAMRSLESEKDVLLQEILLRKSTEKALRSSEQRWRHLADAMPQILFVVSAEGKVHFYNRRFYEYTGRSRDEPVEDAWRKCLHPDDVDLAIAAIKRVMSAEVPNGLEIRLRRDDGEYRWHLAQASRIRGEDDRLLQLYVTCTEIHESKLLRDRLEDSTTLLSQAQRIARLGSYEYDVSRNVGRWSENLFVIFGLEYREGWFDADEFMSRIHPEDVPHVGEAVRAAIDLGKPFSEDYRYVRPDGETIYVRAVANPITEGGRVTRLVGTVQDITEQEATERRLKESERLLEEAELIAGLGSFSFEVPTNKSFWSPALYRVFERDPKLGVFTPEEFFARMHPDDICKYTKQFDRTMQTGQPFKVNYRLQFGNRIKWIEARGSTEMRRGVVVRLVGTCQDVTEQRRITDELERRNEQLRAAEALGDFGSYIEDLDAQRFEWSENLFTIFGVIPSASPMRSDDFLERLHEDDRSKLLEMRKRLYEGMASVDGILRYRKPSGQWRVLRIKSTPSVLEDRLMRVSGTVQDVTERAHLPIAGTLPK
jgi:PAS domain S-box-containing protein